MDTSAPAPKLPTEQTLSSPQPGLPRGAWMVLIAAFLGWMFDGLEMGMFPVVARPALQQLLQTTADAQVGPWMGYITALFLLGAAAGGILFGWLGDKVGRVRAMTASILTYSIFTGMCAFVGSAWQLGFFRFIAALGMGGEWSLGVALVMECWPENKRPLLAGAIGAASNFGYALIGLITWIFPPRPDSWRWVLLSGVGPAILALWIVFKVPESTRWKASVKKASTHPLKEVFGPSLWKTTLLAICFASVALIGTWAAVQWFPLWAEHLTDLAGHKRPEVKGMTMLTLSCGAILGSFVGPLIGAITGRRIAYFGLCLLSLITCGILFRTTTEFGAAFMFGVFLAGTFTAAFYGWLPLYLPELFPTRARATGQGLSYNAGRIFAAVGAITQGQLVSYFGSYSEAGAMITLIYLVGMLMIWFGRETKGQPLPE